MLKLEKISKEYDDFKLNKINLEVDKNDFFAILGPSGCGKSTLLKIISGIIEDFTGSIELKGNNINGVTPQKRDITMVFQDPLLFPNMNVMENIAFGLKMKKVAKQNRKERVTKILKKVGLNGYEKRRVQELSGGQKQRVSIARALVMEPQIILMDEPFSALDVNLREEMQRFVRKLHKKLNMTVIFVTHNRDEAFFLANRVAIMREGKFIQTDSVENIYRKPKNRYVAKFLGEKNIINGNINDGVFSSEYFDLDLGDRYNSQQKKGFIIIKTNAVRIFKKEPENHPFLKAKIKDYYILHDMLYFKLDINGYILTGFREWDGQDFGDDIYVSFDSKKVIFIDEKK